MKNSILKHAIAYLGSRPLYASPILLLAAVDSWERCCRPTTEEEARCCGEKAAREVAMPLKASDPAVIEPEDLK